MSKLIPFALAGVGATATSVGGVYLIKGTSKPVASEGNAGETRKEAATTIFFAGVGDFKTKSTAETKCLKGYFDGLKISTSEGSAEEIGNSKPADGTFFRAAAEGTSETYKSCLSVSWKKTTYAGESGSGSKWNGVFTWLWTFLKGDEGFISFNVAETDETDDHKLKFSGVIYLVGKDTTHGWQIKHRKEVTLSTKVDKSSLDQHFPQPNGSLAGATQSYWGFIESSDKLDEMCKKGSCSGNARTPEPTIQSFLWTGDHKGQTNLKDWANDLGWFDKLYPNLAWNLKDKVANFKGTWSQETQ